MKKSIGFYIKLFASTFYLSAFTFGGGYVIVPLMRKRFVEKYHWLDNEEMLDMIAIAQSAPGPIAVNASIMVGFRLAGVLGSLITVMGTVLPPLITLSVVSIGYTAFRDNRFVGFALRGMQAGIAAVILNVVITMARDIIKQKRWLPVCVMAAAFIAAAVLHISVVAVILACGAIGAADSMIRALRNGGKAA